MSQPIPPSSHVGLAPAERASFAKKVASGAIPSTLVGEALAFAKTATPGARRALLRNPSVTLSGARHYDECILNGERNHERVEKWGADVPGYFDRMALQLAHCEFGIRNLLDLTPMLPGSQRHAFLHQLWQLLKACELLIQRIEREQPPPAANASPTP